MNALTPELLKEKLSSCHYGKFDLVEILIPGNILLYAKPRVILKVICNTAGLENAIVNPFTFYTWLRRYRQKYKSLIQNENGHNWKEFKPTEPMPNRKIAPVEIKPVKNIPL